MNPGETLWFNTEPSLDEVLAALGSIDFTKYEEVVFCGYGEPTCRLDVLLECAKYLKSLSLNKGIPIRLNTNGLSDLINGKKTVPLLAEYIDSISISLNAPDAESYNKMCNPSFKHLGDDTCPSEAPYNAMLQFANDCKGSIPNVTLSVVGCALGTEDISRCQDICASMDIPLRVR